MEIGRWVGGNASEERYTAQIANQYGGEKAPRHPVKTLS